ncbi:tyrosine-type recombinase/integrase [Phytoactinopolyspora halophila]|nr:tyrosine-type recombinase/integrase [Phytoactinopolyspora halophila]
MLKLRVKPVTYKTAWCVVKNFVNVAGDIYASNLQPKHVEAWLGANSDSWKPATKQMYVARIGHFQRWLKSRGYIDPLTDIIEDFRHLKTSRGQQLFVPSSRFDELLDVAERQCARDRALVALGLYSLVRRSEMINIRWGDIEERISIYRTKTDDVDSLPISKYLEPELNRWRSHLCRLLQITAPDPRWPVICALQNKDPRAASDETYVPDRAFMNPGRRVWTALTTLGYTDKGLGTHTLRRSGAHAMLDELIEKGVGQDMALIIVKEMLGHADVSMTMTYLNWRAHRRKRDEIVANLGSDAVPSHDNKVVQLRAG